MFKKFFVKKSIKSNKKNEFDFDEWDDEKIYPFHNACKSETVTLEIIQNFLNNKQDLLQRDTGGKTPFHYACANKKISPPIINLMIKNNADVSTMDDSRKTPLHYACQNENILFEVIELIINRQLMTSKKVKVDITDRYSATPLHYACENENIKNIPVVNLLLQSGADPEKKDAFDRYPFDYAFKNSNAKVLKLLLDKGTDTNKKDFFGDTYIHRACKNQPVEVLKILAEYGGKLEEKDRDNNQAIHIALKNKNREVVKFLLEKKTYNFEKNDEEQTLLICAIAHENIDLKIVDMLLKKVYPEYVEKLIKPALEYAIENKKQKLMLFLILFYPQNLTGLELKGDEWTKCRSIMKLLDQGVFVEDLLYQLDYKKNYPTLSLGHQKNLLLAFGTFAEIQKTSLKNQRIPRPIRDIIIRLTTTLDEFVESICNMNSQQFEQFISLLEDKRKLMPH
ncbi:MAG: ankyrin repeat domain-containing protein [Legionella longbeachae]|nr:ankyrin repeat domain-containing protein [Legionella longbeachae]